MRALLVLTSSMLLGVFLACGGNTPDPKTAGGEPSASMSAASSAPVVASSTAEAPPVASSAPPVVASASATQKSFDALSPDEKRNVMKTVVVPKLGEIFKAHDGKKFKEFGCKTCHGAAGVKDGSYKMPNAALPKLSYKDGFKKHQDKQPDITKMMMTKVLPEMQAILGKGPIDPKTKTGFGCGGCHIVEP